MLVGCEAAGEEGLHLFSERLEVDVEGTGNQVIGVAWKALEDPARGRLLDRTFDARVAIGDEEPASMAKAMGEALDDAVGQVADAVGVSVRPHGASGPR